MNELEERVQQFNSLSLPGQPMAMHMGTSYLVNDLWREVQRLRKQVAAQPTLAGGRAGVCPECGSEIAVCMMGHYCGEKTPAAKA